MQPLAQDFQPRPVEAQDVNRVQPVPVINHDFTLFPRDEEAPEARVDPYHVENAHYTINFLAAENEHLRHQLQIYEGAIRDEVARRMRADMDLDAMRLTLEEARALAHSMRTTDRLVSWICDNTSGGNSKPGDLEARLQAMLEQRRTDNEKFDAFVRTSEELNIKYDSLQAHHASEVSRLQADTELLRSQADALREKLRDARGELATTAEPRGRQRKRAATFKSTARLRSGTEASRGRKRDASV